MNGPHSAELTLSVSELAQALRLSLEVSFPSGVWVAGEIESINRARSGHVYFNLVERSEHAAADAAPIASIDVVLFSDDRARVNEVIRRYGDAIRMTDGLRVRICGMLDFFARRGQLQLRMIAIDPSHTLGALASQREVLLQKLTTEGVLRRNAAMTLAAVPLHVGIVTSLDSAAHGDIMRVLERSGLSFHVVEVHAAVQGRVAPAAIAAGVGAAADAGVDVVVLARGGGSRTDLAAFDHELVARAIVRCGRPVFTGIGHDTDRSVADEVAHTACSTPTAAADAVVSVVEAWLERLDGAASRLVRTGRAVTDRAAQRATQARSRLSRAAPAAQRRATARVERASARLSTAGRYEIRNAQRQLDSVETRVRSLDPSLILQRGWSLTRLADGTLLRSTQDVGDGDRIVTHLADGNVTSTIGAQRDTGEDRSR